MMIAAVRVGFFRKVEIPHLSLPQCCFLLWDLDVSGKEERDKQKVDFADQTFVSKILFFASADEVRDWKTRAFANRRRVKVGQHY